VPTVEVRETLGAPIERVWSLIRDLGAYPHLMEPVRALDILEEGDGWTLSAWEVELKGSVLKWIEREEIDPARHRIDYHQVEGDFLEFAGHWQLEALSPAETEAVLVVRFDIGIPMLAEMLDPVAERAIRENSRRMLRSLAPGVEEQ
jgi:ribosome-associated toxin RatA of RatAB toxin-antitoxin module